MSLDEFPSFCRREKPQIQKASKYGFAEKVVDGMFVSINSVIVAFKAPGFKASCNMSRITIQSTDQNWNVPNNLRKTRIKDEQREQVLNFKEIKWGTMRLDADAAYVEVVLLDFFQFSSFLISFQSCLFFFNSFVC